MSIEPKYSIFKIYLATCCIIYILGACEYNEKSVEKDKSEELADLFKSPPSSARPGVFWFWMGGMISEEGITKDVEALSAQGIGKVLLMHMPDQCPYPRQWAYRDYPGKVNVLSDEWFNLVNYAIGECDRVGIEVGSFMCPGWGHVGGPWVPESKGTKKMAITKVEVMGPSKVNQLLPRPKTSIGSGGGNQIPEWNHAYNLRPKAKENYFADEAVLAVPNFNDQSTVRLNSILNISDHLDENGNLTWDAPAGDWTIYRVCLISENGINHPAPPESIGLEVDRMDPEAVRIVFDNMIGRILREARAKGYQSFKYFETDSYETGFQDFGIDYQEEFKNRRGYNCASWLPSWLDKSLVIESQELTMRFRQDMLRTISELWAERFQGTLRKIADENDIEWMTEPYFKIPLDWTTVGGKSTIPGAEFWVGENGKMGSQHGNAPEIAALYNRRVAWAESFTAESYNSAWRNDPWLLKRSGDEAFSKGINLFYMHGFVHNPFPDKYRPGLTMGYWGTQLSRHVTWWPYSLAWHQYLARCQFMLQQGKPVYHALRYPNTFESDPMVNSGSYRTVRLPDEILFNNLSVSNGKLILPHGQEFSVLHLTGEALRPEALQKIKLLVESGAVVIGNPPPPRSASLENFPECDKQVVDLISELWGNQGESGSKQTRTYGLGKVISGMTLDEGMVAIGKQPDFSYTQRKGITSTELLWYQRNVNDEKHWFVCNNTLDQVAVEASFEVNGMQPEWWDPVSGELHELPDFKFENGRTILPLSFSPLQSGFVVFRKKTEGRDNQSDVIFTELKPIKEIQGSWDVSFDPCWGGPKEKVTFAQLTDWSNNEIPGIKYYSGTAVYQKIIDLPSVLQKLSSPIYLDLGKVHNLAQVRINGKDLGTIWCAPWRVKIPSGLLKMKGNKLEIAVVNTWVNRLIGDEFEPDDFETEPGNQIGTRLGSYDVNIKSRGLKDLPYWLSNNEQRPSTGRYTFTSWFYYNKEAPLQPAGLLGPVKIMEDLN